MGKASGIACMTPLLATGCSQEVLKQIWDLADVDKDGSMDSDEFAVAMYLCNQVKEGGEVPAELPSCLIPPKAM